jgi:hypothetical protein
VRLQVTTDNENFSVVDVSNVTSSEAIMDRVFSKVGMRMIPCAPHWPLTGNAALAPLP